MNALTVRKVRFMGLPCWYDGETLEGRNWLADRLIPVGVLFHNYFLAPFGFDEFQIREERKR